MRSIWLPWLALVIACGGEGGASTEVKAPYPAWSETSQASYVQTLPTGATAGITASVVGTKVIGGVSYQVFRMNDPASPSPGLDVWATRPDEETLTIAGAEYDTSKGSALGIPLYASGTLDQPLRLNLDPPVGKPQTLQVKGTSIIGKGNPPQAGEVAVTYTLVEDGASVTTPAGPIAGCRHFSASAMVPLLFGTAPIEVAGDVYYSPTLGLVKAALTKPIAFGMGFLGTKDASDLGGGFASVQRLGVVGKGQSGSWRLDTTDAHQQVDADKETHAKMLLEVRWVDPVQAKTTQQPYVQPEFGTVIGIFPSTLVQSPVSLFHPEENGQGYVYWVGYVDQAAKNEAANPIAYHVRVTYDTSFSPIRLTGRIVYKRTAAR